MKAKLKLTLLAVAWFASVIVVYLAGAAPAWKDRHFGKRYDPEKAQDQKELLRLIYDVYPALTEIKAFVKSQHRVPSLNEFNSLPNLTAAYRKACLDQDIGWSYIDDAPNFRLYYKINWDAFLTYGSFEDSWAYNPGDGSPVADLQP